MYCDFDLVRSERDPLHFCVGVGATLAGALLLTCVRASERTDRPAVRACLEKSKLTAVSTIVADAK